MASRNKTQSHRLLTLPAEPVSIRLLKSNSVGQLSLTKDLLDDLPPCAILLHTWGADGDEVTFSDLENESCKSKTDYAKLRFCGDQARKDGIEYFWVDTCWPQPYDRSFSEVAPSASSRPNSLSRSKVTSCLLPLF